MMHTNFYDAIKAIEKLAEKELAQAIKAIGGVFIPDYENGDDEIIIVGSFKHCPGSEDIIVTKVELNKSGIPVIYGKFYQCQELDEQPVYFLEPGYIHFILDAIPEIEIIKDISYKEEAKEVVRIINDILIGNDDERN